MNLSSWIERRAEHDPPGVAIVFEGAEIAWRDFRDQCVGAAAALRRHGVGRGDRVALLGCNSPTFLALLFGCARIGAMLVPLNWRLAVEELRYIVENAGPRLLFHDTDFTDTARALAGRGALPLTTFEAGEVDDASSVDDPVLIVYTSGTTGRPKGAVLTQSALLWNAVNSTAMHELTSADRVLTTLPMFHVGGLNIQTLPALHAGATVILHRRFDPTATLGAIATARPSLTVLVPAQISALIEHPLWAETDLSSLRAVTTGSMIVPVPLIEAFHRRGVTVTQVYGTTETAPIAVYLPLADARRKAGSCGKAALHSAMRLVDGEVRIKGPHVMQGYWNDPAATAAALDDGWFKTGDVGHLDEDGFLYIDERRQDLIISGGENIYPAELERILAEEPGLAEAAVVARPDPRWGEVPIIVAVRRGGASVQATDIMRRFEGRLARFKHPRDVVFVDRLPRNALGKVLRRELRERVR